MKIPICRLVKPSAPSETLRYRSLCIPLYLLLAPLPKRPCFTFGHKVLPDLCNSSPGDDPLPLLEIPSFRCQSCEKLCVSAIHWCMLKRPGKDIQEEPRMSPQIRLKEAWMKCLYPISSKVHTTTWTKTYSANHPLVLISPLIFNRM